MSTPRNDVTQEMLDSMADRATQEDIDQILSSIEIPNEEFYNKYYRPDVLKMAFNIWQERRALGGIDSFDDVLADFVKTLPDKGLITGDTKIDWRDEELAGRKFSVPYVNGTPDYSGRIEYKSQAETPELSEQENVTLSRLAMSMGVDVYNPQIWNSIVDTYLNGGFQRNRDFAGAIQASGVAPTPSTETTTETETMTAPDGTKYWRTVERDVKGNVVKQSSWQEFTQPKEPAKKWWELEPSEARAAAGQFYQEPAQQPTEWDNFWGKPAPSWLRKFMSEEEYAKEQAIAKSHHDLWNEMQGQATAEQTARSVGRATDIYGTGFNPQWAEDAYQGLVKNLATIGQPPSDKEAFMRNVAETGIVNALESAYKGGGWYNNYPTTAQTPVYKTQTLGAPWWTREWNLSAQAYNQLTPEEKASYQDYLNMKGRNWWQPTTGAISGKAVRATPFYQRR